MVIYSKLVINSVEYTTSEKINIVGAVGESNSSGRFNISFLNSCGVYSNTFSVGNIVEVSLKKDSTSFDVEDKIIVGLVEDISFKGVNNNTETIVLTGTDYTSKLMNVTVKPIVYNNIDIADIVSDIISDNVPEITTTNVVTTGKIKGQINFNHTPIFDAIKSMAEEVDYLFYIDKNLDLHFEPKGSVSSGITLDTTNSTATVQILNSQFKVTNNGDFANAVWVYGDRQLTGWSNTFTANGGSVYTLDYKPTNTRVYVAGSTTPKVGGVFELTNGDVGSPIQYLVNYDAKQVIFVSGVSAGNNIPSSGATTFKIDYERDIPIIRFGQDNASVIAYGKKEKVIVDKNITNPTTATDRLVTELKNKSSPIIDGTVAIHGIANLPAGQTIIINHPYHNISYQTYDILETTYNITKQTLLNENIITLRLNKRLIELTDTIKNLMLSVKELQAKDSIESGDVYPRLEFATGSVGMRVSNWAVYRKDINDSFILGHPYNGVLGNRDFIGTSGVFNIVNSGTSAFEENRSGNRGFRFAEGCIGSSIGSIVVDSLNNSAYSFWLKVGPSGINPSGETILSNGVGYSSAWIGIGGAGVAQTGSNTIVMESFVNNMFVEKFNINKNINNGSFHHFVLNFGSPTKNLWVDGSVASSDTPAVGGSISVFKFIGTSGTTNYPQFLKQTLDEFAIYNRVLTSGEIASLYSRINFPVDNLKLFLKFDDRNGSNQFKNSVLNGSYFPASVLGDGRSSNIFYQSGGEI